MKLFKPERTMDQVGIIEITGDIDSDAAWCLIRVTGALSAPSTGHINFPNSYDVGLEYL